MSRSSLIPIKRVVFAITPPYLGGGLPALSHALLALGDRSIATPPVPLLHVGISSPWWIIRKPFTSLIKLPVSHVSCKKYMSISRSFIMLVIYSSLRGSLAP